MFGKNPVYVPYVQRVEQHTHTTVQRQPTSEDARLLKDLEDQAWSKITDIMVQDVPGFNAQLIEFKHAHDIGNMKIKRYVAFKVNGTKMVVDITSSAHSPEFVTARKMADAIMQEIMKQWNQG